MYVLHYLEDTYGVFYFAKQLFEAYRVSQKTWTFFEIGRISSLIRESFRNFVR